MVVNSYLIYVDLEIKQSQDLMLTLCISVVLMREEAGLVRVSASPPPPPPDTADTHRDIIELHSHSAPDTIIGSNR